MSQPALRHSLGTYERVDKWTDKVPEDSKGADVYHTRNVKLISFVQHVDIPAMRRIETFNDLATATKYYLRMINWQSMRCFPRIREQK